MTGPGAGTGSWPGARETSPDPGSPAGSTHEVRLDQPGHVGIIPRGLLALAPQAGVAGVIGAGAGGGGPAQAGGGGGGGGGRRGGGGGGPPPPRRSATRQASSAKTTSRTQCRPFSTRQWFR